MRKWHTLPLLLMSLLIATLLVPGAAAAAAKRTQRVSVGSAGVQGNGQSGSLYAPSVSADGRYVAFDSVASNLVAGDTNGFQDVFVRDRKLHKTIRVSVSSAGAQGDNASYLASISANGRYVAFVSDAGNLVAGDTNGYSDVFVRDRKLHKTYLVSVDSTGVQGNSYSFTPSISANGRYVAFVSDASNLVPGDSNSSSDVFVRDRKLHKTYLVSVDSTGVQGNSYSDEPSISADGRYVAFRSFAGNLVSGDSNGYLDVFVRDRKLHKTVRVSVDSAGLQGNSFSDSPSISADGRYVAFRSFAGNLVSGDSNNASDVFVRDRKLHKTVRVSLSTAGVQGNGGSGDPAISANGRSVAFDSGASNLVAGDSNAYVDVFVRDRKLHKTSLVSVDSAGIQGNNDSFGPAISADGRYVPFDSNASDLVAGDTNGYQDIFVRGPYR
jgi:Tol biopolymer transport system component